MTARPVALLVIIASATLAGCFDIGGKAACASESAPAFSAGLLASDPIHAPLHPASGPSALERGMDVPVPPPGAALAASAIDWPDFAGAQLRILDHGAFFGFDDAAATFASLTNSTVTHTEAADTGSALNQAIRDKGATQFDVIYGLDNTLLSRAMEAGILAAYRPALADRVADEHVFFDDVGRWPATPVDHGYIAINIDEGHALLQNATVADLWDVCERARTFATQDPNLSTPGLGFLLTTIATFGDAGEYTWLDYWDDLLRSGALVTSDWTQAYEVHFSGGYGIWLDGHIGDRPIVTSYTSSPAYEAYYEAEDVASVLLYHGAAPASYKQVQTMGILQGTPNRALAEAWIEFTLTDDFQALAAPANAVYPVVASVSTDDVFGAVDPDPGTFPAAQLDWRIVGGNLQDWLRQWTDLCEQHGCR